MSTIVLGILAVVAAATAGVYVHSARLRLRLVHLVDSDPSVDVEAHSLAFASFRKEAHTSLFYGVLALAAAVVAVVGGGETITAAFGALIVPAFAGLWWSRSSSREARMARNRFDIARRAGSNSRGVRQHNRVPL